MPAHQGDDEFRLNAYIAIYGSSALERYAPGGELSGAAISAISELRNTARLDWTERTSLEVLTRSTSLSTAPVCCCWAK
jgi:hypothetical protein